MQAETFPAIYGAQVEIDVCHHCNGLWFDGRESLQLTPGATLKLFASMYERKESARQPLVPAKRCPRCTGPLVETFDTQRGTRFSYFRCEAHGRFTTFFQFLREKNLVRSPTPMQVEELRITVKQIDCSSCGAPIVLAETLTCAHCSAPLTILSDDTINLTLRELQKQEAARTTVDPTIAARLVMDQMRVIRHEREVRDPLGGSGSGDLVELGARALIGIVSGLFR